MSNWEKVNPNPKGKNVGDCVVRAICLAEGVEWERIYRPVSARVRDE